MSMNGLEEGELRRHGLAGGGARQLKRTPVYSVNCEQTPSVTAPSWLLCRARGPPWVFVSEWGMFLAVSEEEGRAGQDGAEKHALSIFSA